MSFNVPRNSVQCTLEWKTSKIQTWRDTLPTIFYTSYRCTASILGVTSLTRFCRSGQRWMNQHGCAIARREVACFLSPSFSRNAGTAAGLCVQVCWEGWLVVCVYKTLTERETRKVKRRRTTKYKRVRVRGGWSQRVGASISPAPERTCAFCFSAFTPWRFAARNDK